MVAALFNIVLVGGFVSFIVDRGVGGGGGGGGRGGGQGGGGGEPDT